MAIIQVETNDLFNNTTDTEVLFQNIAAIYGCQDSSHMQNA